MAKQPLQHYQLEDRFWEVWLDGKDLYTRHGKKGSTGQVKIKNFASVDAAKAGKAKAIAAKEKEGFWMLTDTTAADMAQRAADKKAATTKQAAKSPKAKVAGAEVDDAGDIVPEGTTRLEHGGSKFWQYTRDGETVTIQFGKIGTTGQTQVKKYGNDWEARSEIARQADEKKRKGYTAVLTGKQAPPSPVATNAALEKAIFARPADDDGFMVYADWLQQQGDQRGELAAMQTALAKTPQDKKLKNAEKKLLWDQRAHFFGPLAVYVGKKPTESSAVRATWRQGWMDSLVLSAVESWADDDGPSVAKVEELVRVLPKVASAKFLRELVIAKPVAEDEYNFANAVKALVEVLPSLPMLKRLTIGQFSYEDSELSWSHLGKLDALWPAAKQLEYLKLHVGTMALGKIEAPNLKELRIETGGLDKKAVAALVSAKLPKLETLNLWFGQENYGCDCKAKDLLPFLDKKQFPKVKHLGIANTTWGDELCEHWPTATILPQLETLDLSRSHLTVAGVKKLVAHADAFAHLKSIDFSECLLNREGQKLAQTLCKAVNVKKQENPTDFQPDPDDPDEEDLWWRYTAVGE